MLKLISGLLTPIVAIIAAYIAYQQWQTNRYKLNLDKYERRLRIYEEVRKILSIILRDANVSTNDLLNFRTSVSEADFLFGPEVTKYIDEIYQHGLNLWKWTTQYKDYSQEKPEGYDHQKVVEEMHKELTWLTSNSNRQKNYLKVTLMLANKIFIQSTPNGSINSDWLTVR